MKIGKGELARDVMTQNPSTVSQDETLQEVARIMKREDIGVVPVTDGSHKILGLVTDRDIVVRVVAEGNDPSNTKVDRVMSTDVIFVREDEPIDNVYRKMSERQIRRIPVVNEREELVGIVAQADLATRVDRDKKLGETVEDISR